MSLLTTVSSAVATAFTTLSSFAITADYVHEAASQSYNTTTGAASGTQTTDSSVIFLPDEYSPIVKLVGGSSALGGNRVLKIQHGDRRLFARAGSAAGQITSEPKKGDYITISGADWYVVDAIDHVGVVYEIQFRKPE